MDSHSQVVYLGHAMHVAWCPLSLWNWVSRVVSQDEKGQGVFRFLGLSPEWSEELDTRSQRSIPRRIVSSTRSVLRSLQNKKVGRIEEEEDSPVTLYSERLGFYLYASGLSRGPGDSWVLFFKVDSYLHRLYPRYRALAVAGLLASREWGWPIQTAHVVGWKGEGQAVSLQDGDEEWLQGLLDKTRSILEGGDPSLLQLEAPPCRSCYQLSCPKKAYLADLESSEELELINA